MAKETTYTVDYNDPRLKSVKTEEKAAINDVDKTYGEMIDGTDAFYNKQIKAAKDYGNKQTEIQNEALGLTIKGIEQDKAELKEDYTKEQSGAYVDWQKQSGAYGANAEKMASAGLAGSGYSESSQVSMYNQYQSRVATARQAYVRAKADYDLAIAEARNQNSSKLAEIAYNTLQTTLQLSLEGFQYKNKLITEMTNQKLAVKESYWTRYQDVLKQINTENALAEEVRQYNQTHALQLKQYQETVRANKADEAYKNSVLALDKEKFAYQKKRDSELDVKDDPEPTETKGYSMSKKSYKAKQTKDEKVKYGLKTKGKTTKKTTKGSGTSTVNMKSLNDLGLSGKSAKAVDDLVKKGVITEVVNPFTKKLEFKRSTKALKNKMLYSRLG